MARLKLAQGVDLKQLGHVVFHAAAAFHRAGGQPDRVKHSAIEACLDRAGGQINIHFHYDRTTTDAATGQTTRDIHVVVPDFSGRVRDPIKALDEFDLADVAAESMGYVVIMGCGD